MLGKTFAGLALGLSLFAMQGDDLVAQSPDGYTGFQPAPGTLVVLSGQGDEALLIDPLSQRVLGRLPTGPDPRAVALSPDGRFAYITSYAWEPGAPAPVPAVEAEAAAYGAVGGVGAAGGARVGSGSRGVTVVDLLHGRIHAVFQPGTYRNLDGIRVGARGKRLWMTAEADSGIVELDALTGEVKMLWKTGGASPRGLEITRDNRRLFVANGGSGSVTMIDRATVVPETIETGGSPDGLALSEDERELWVANRADHTISVIDTRRLREIARFSSGGTEPTRVEFHPGGHEVWISHAGSGTVTVLDVTSAAVLASIDVPGEPRALAFSDDGGLAYVSIPLRDQVQVIDVAAREVVDTIDTGSLPGGLIWSGQPAAGSSR